MPVIEAVQTFVGIVNENEFYSHHYLPEVFKSDIRERLEQWTAVEEADPTRRTPYKRLAAYPATGSCYATPAGATPLPRSNLLAFGRCGRQGDL